MFIVFSVSPVKGLKSKSTSATVKQSTSATVKQSTSSPLLSQNEQKEWPSLGAPKVPDWTTKILESPRLKDWPSGDEPKLIGRSPEVLMTPESFSDSILSNVSNNSSVYHTPPEQNRSLNNSRNLLDRSLETRGRKSGEKLKTFKVESPSPKFSQSGPPDGNHGYRSWSTDVKYKSSPSDRTSSASTAKSSSARQSKENSSKVPFKSEPKGTNLSSSMPPVSSVSPSKSLDPHAKSFFPSAHIDREVPVRSKVKESKSLAEVGAEWLSHTEASDMVQNREKSNISDRSKHSSMEENNLNKSSENSAKKEMPKEKVMNWFDMEEEEVEETKCSNYASDRLLSDDLKYTDKEESQSSNISAKVVDADVQEAEEEYDWFDMKPKDESRYSANYRNSPVSNVDTKYSANCESSSTLNDAKYSSNPENSSMSNVNSSNLASSSSSKQEKVSEKKIDWFDAGDDDDEDTDNDLEWETDTSDEENSLQNIQKDIVALPTAIETVMQNTDDSESSESFKTKARYNFPKNEPPRWVPGRRKCTLCGDEGHVIHDCPEKTSKGFFL